MFWQLRQMLRIERWKEEYGTHLLQRLEALGRLDALSALGTFAFNHPDRLPAKTWKQHKEYPDIYVPDTRTKNGKQIKKFLDYYLPTTIKLLNAYDRMGAQGIEGENISGTMKSINEMLDTAIAAYHKLLDSLFANQALDVETDIEVMNTLLKREGLSGSAGIM